MNSLDNEIFRTLECGLIIKRILNANGPEWLGYWTQAIAAHILLRLGVKISEVNNTGHPDICGFIEGGILRMEIECDSTGRGLHALDPDDIEGLKPRSPLDQSYYGLLKATDIPEWVIVPYNKIKNINKPSYISLLKAVADSKRSSLWTSIFIRILLDNKENIESLHYNDLQIRALSNRGL
ncbi:MAG: hypothetical protein QXS68_04845 [Candidatus Methanomethylicaceae archaeon]